MNQSVEILSINLFAEFCTSQFKEQILLLYHFDQNVLKMFFTAFNFILLSEKCREKQLKLTKGIINNKRLGNRERRYHNDTERHKI